MLHGSTVKQLNHKLSQFKSKPDLGTLHNDPLPDHVQHKIRRKLLDAEGRLACFEFEAPCLNSATRIDIRYSNLALRIQSYRAAIAPHWKLPNDVLLEIFFRCTPSRIAARPHLSGPYAEPHNLTRVCSKWRHLVLHTSELWRDIFVRYDTPSDLERNIALVKDIILLSGSLLISLSIQVELNLKLESLQNQNPISDLVIEVAGRLKNLTWFGNSEILKNFLILPAGSVQSLEDVFLGLVGKPSANQSFLLDWPIQVFKDHTSKLQRFTVVSSNNSLRAVNPFQLHLPWHQMTHLRFSSYDMRCEEFLLLVYQCPNLEEIYGNVSRGGLYEDEVNKLPSTIPIHLRLNQLRLYSVEDSGFNRLFPRLNLPNLKSFYIHTRIHVKSSNWSNILLPLFVRSNCLTHLEIEAAFSISALTIDTYLRELPLLVSFSLAKGQPLLEQTLEKIGSGELVPKLQTLECKVTQRAFEPFMRMLEQRCVSKEEAKKRGFEVMRSVSAITRSKDDEMVDIWNCAGRVEHLRAQGLYIIFYPSDLPL